MTLIAIAIVLSLSNTNISASQDTGPMSAGVVAADAERERVALEWLALIDAGDWQAGFASTASAFQTAVTPAAFSATVQQARDPLGRVEGRRAVGFHVVSEAGKDYQVVRFQTDFANRSAAFERVTLEREQGVLKVSGYWIE